MLGVDHDIESSLPVFIPPRKRQSSKKTNGVQNYVDHIVNVQVNCDSINLNKNKISINFLFFIHSHKIANTRYHQV